MLVSVGVPIVSNCRTTRRVHGCSTGIPVVTVATFTCTSSRRHIVRDNFSKCVPGPVGTHRLHTRVGSVVRGEVMLLWREILLVASGRGGRIVSI